MARNKRIPDEVIQTASMIDLPRYLQQQGVVLREFRSCWEYGQGAEKVTLWQDPRDGHYQWKRQYDRLTGNPIQWLQCFGGSRSFADAAYRLWDWAGGKPIPKQRIDTSAPGGTVEEKKKCEPFQLPPANSSFRRCMAYLCKTRRIDPGIVTEFHKAGLIYESAIHHNAVFVGRDADGVARHASLRGTVTNKKGKAFRINQEGSDPGYAFHWVGVSPHLFVCEAPIDLLSFVSLHLQNWRSHSYTALCGIFPDAMLQFLQDHPYIKKVGLCLDNDKYGRKGNRRCAEALEQLGIVYDILAPKNKDWNDDLKEVRP